MRRKSHDLLETGNAKLETGVGAVAQLGERLVCNQEATGSIPVSSTNQPDVGRQCDNRIRVTVHESCLAPNIGLEELQSVHDLK